MFMDTRARRIKSADGKKHLFTTDEEGTVPSRRFCEVFVCFGVHVKNRLVVYLECLVGFG